MSERVVSFRILPELTHRTRHFWTGGARGELRVLRCQDCGTYTHQPTPNAGNPRIAVAAAGGGNTCGVMLLSRS